MDKIIDFFLKNAKLNYVLLVFALLGGIYSYQAMSKEIFPPIELDKIVITGGYNGTSADILDKMVVNPIEEEINNISGISKITSTINSNIFNIVAELSKNQDKDTILQKIKDGISAIKKDLPNDMNEPIASHVVAKFPLILVNISSNKEPHDYILQAAKKLKSKLATIKDLTDIDIYGEGDMRVQIEVDTNILQAYNLNPTSLLQSISSLSSIFPIGKIEEIGKKHYFISTQNGPKTPHEFLDTIIKVDGKTLRLKDVAKISKGYKNDNTISSFNGRKTIIMNVSKTKDGNAMELANKVKNIVDELQQEYKKLYFGTFSDTSVYIRNRLNTVTSNILFGLILVGFAMYLLINNRISFIVVLGVPTSFVISLIIFYLGGYSINMMSLLGALIALGVIVDDAIIVAENIQRHIEEGMDVSKAAYVGTKEVFSPVMASSLTTVFAFLPMLLMTGEMGVFIKIIPISISILILSSVVESFIFLPLHAKHVLKKGAKKVQWSFMLNTYEKMIRILVHRRKLTILLFYILVPTLIYLGFSTSKFQLFPKFDGDQMNITAKLPVNTTLQETYDVAFRVESYLIANKERFFIDNATTIAGFRMDVSAGTSEYGNNFFHIFVDLKKAKPDNLVTKYITPYLSLDYDSNDRVRTLPSYELETLIGKELLEVMKKFHYEEFDTKGPRAGIADTPIEIYIETNSAKKAHKALSKIKQTLIDTNQTHTIIDNAAFGASEIKLKINTYGQNLGINEKLISNALGGYFLEASVSKGFDERGIFDIVVKSSTKDYLETLKNFQLYLLDGKIVPLKDVADFIEVQNYQKIYKIGGNRRWLVASEINKGANVNEIMKSIKPTLNEITHDEQINIVYGGEEEKNRQLQREMTMASLLALFLMSMTLLIMFNSFVHTLMIISVIPFSILGVFLGHQIMGLDLTMPSIIGALGLAGVVINDGIIMLDFIRKATTVDELLARAKLRLRPIVLTSITTLAGLSTLIFFPSGQAIIMQPLAVSLGFGLFWGTFLNLVYLPTLYALVTRIKDKK